MGYSLLRLGRRPADTTALEAAFRAIGALLEVHDLADPRLRDREAEVLERRLDGLSLRVENAVLRPDEHRRLHPSTTDGLSR